MKYRYEIEFEAEDDEEAKEMIWGTENRPDLGASDCFSGIHREKLTQQDGRDLREVA